MTIILLLVLSVASMNVSSIFGLGVPSSQLRNVGHMALLGAAFVGIVRGGTSLGPDSRRIVGPVAMFTVYTLVIAFAFNALTQEAMVSLSWLATGVLATLGVRWNEGSAVVAGGVVSVFATGVVTLYILTLVSTGLSGAAQINSIYYVVLAVPFVLLLRLGLIRGLITALVTLGVLFSLKLTAIIAVVAAYTLPRFLGPRSSPPLMQRQVGVSRLVAVSILVPVVVFAYSAIDGDLLGKIERASADGGSGRTGMFQQVLAGWFDNSLSAMLFGSGPGATANDFGLSAHNDWLEVLYNFGFVGLVLYAFLVFGLWKYVFVVRRLQPRLFAPFLASVTIFSIVSIPSNLIFQPTYVVLLGVMWGLVIRVTERNSER